MCVFGNSLKCVCQLIYFTISSCHFEFMGDVAGVRYNIDLFLQTVCDIAGVTSSIIFMYGVAGVTCYSVCMCMLHK